MNEEYLRKLNTCIQCGTCVGSCFSGKITALNIRKILMRFIAKGEPIKDDDSIWLCVTCYACQERCPRGIPLADIILEARREFIREKGLPDKLKSVFESLARYSAMVPAEDCHIRLRKELGLPLYHAQFVKEAREEVSEIARKYLGGLLE